MHIYIYTFKNGSNSILNSYIRIYVYIQIITIKSN